MEYFPDYSENIIPDRTFLFTILSTIWKAELKELIKKSQTNHAVQSEKDKEQMIEIRNDIKDEIFAILSKKSKDTAINHFLQQRVGLIWPK